MSSKQATQSLQSAIRRTRASCQCSTSSRTSSIRSFSASSSKPQAQHDNEPASRPRWSYTPKQMIAPFPVQLKDPDKAWQCNEDPAKLDRFYVKFLGRGGDSVLTEEAKWLAITHKSFDQGRRGFNDRLSFFGRRILNLQTTLAVLHSPLATETQSLPAETHLNPALEGLANLSGVQISDIVTKRRLARLATQMGMPEIMRWKPKNPQNLEGSGIEAVLTTTMYAIIGAIALQKGGDIAAQVTRERILKPLGVS